MPRWWKSVRWNPSIRNETGRSKSRKWSKSDFLIWNNVSISRVSSGASLWIASDPFSFSSSFRLPIAFPLESFRSISSFRVKDPLKGSPRKDLNVITFMSYFRWITVANDSQSRGLFESSDASLVWSFRGYLLWNQWIPYGDCRTDYLLRDKTLRELWARSSCQEQTSKENELRKRTNSEEEQTLNESPENGDRTGYCIIITNFQHINGHQSVSEDRLAGTFLTATLDAVLNWRFNVGEIIGEIQVRSKRDSSEIQARSKWDACSFLVRT